jgi:hypothetical protein
MKKLFVLTPGKSALFAFGLFSAAAVSEGPALAGKEGYHFSEVRSHQFVEAWPSLNSDEKSIHIKVKVSNGVQIAPFSPTVWIDLKGAGGVTILRFTKTYSLGPSGWGHGVDRTYDYDIPKPELWAMTEDVTLRAFERPPAPGPANMPSIPLIELK